MFGKKMAEIDRHSYFPEMSLTYWGDEALEAADKKFKKAQQWQTQARYRKAYDGYQDCVKIVGKKKSSLGVMAYLEILDRQTFCLNGIQDFFTSLACYKKREAVLEKKPDVIHIPRGRITLTGKTQGSGRMLATNYAGKALVLMAMKTTLSGIEKHGPEFVKTALDGFSLAGDEIIKGMRVAGEINSSELIFSMTNYLAQICLNVDRMDLAPEAVRIIDTYKGERELEPEHRPDYLRLSTAAHIHAGNFAGAKESAAELIAHLKANGTEPDQNDLLLRERTIELAEESQV